MVCKFRETALQANLSPMGDATFTQKQISLWQTRKENIEKLYTFAETLFGSDEQPTILANKYKEFAKNAHDWFSSQISEVERLTDWVNFKRAKKEAELLGLKDFIIKTMKGKIPPDDWKNAYSRRLYILLSDKIIQSNDTLAKFRSSSHESLIERFKMLDKEIYEASGHEIRSKLQELRPDATWVQAESAETTILKKELNKKRRIKPLRRLFAEIPNLILTLRPCLMMSPLTVSQLLDPEIYQFDLTIFDEASQIPPEYAIGAIMRAKQVVIAGDRHQLPPTRFFQSIDTDEYDEEDYDIDEDYE